jgi:hypothetical protein
MTEIGDSAYRRCNCDGSFCYPKARAGTRVPHHARAGGGVRWYSTWRLRYLAFVVLCGG